MCLFILMFIFKSFIFFYPFNGLNSHPFLGTWGLQYYPLLYSSPLVQLVPGHGPQLGVELAAAAGPQHGPAAARLRTSPPGACNQQRWGKLGSEGLWGLVKHLSQVWGQVVLSSAIGTGVGTWAGQSWCPIMWCMGMATTLCGVPLHSLHPPSYKCAKTNNW